MPMAKCGGCGRFISTIEGAKCSKCSMQFHRACVGLPAKGNAASNWRCPECKKDQARDNRAETPVRGASTAIDSAGTHDGSPEEIFPEHPESAVEGAVKLPHSQTNNSIDETLCSRVDSSDLQLIIKEIRAVREEIQCFRREMEAEMGVLKASMLSCNTRMDVLEARVDALEQRAIPTSTDTTAVNGIIEELKRDLNDRDQELLANDIDITNLPEISSENPAHIVKTLSVVFGVNIEDRDIVSAERVGGRQLNVTNPSGPTEFRPRTLVVRLARRELRDELLKNARVRREATTKELNIPGPSKRFYLNERLTRTNRYLFRKARDAASLAGWRYVWTRRGHILARIRDGEPARRIRSEADITNIFGPSNNTS